MAITVLESAEADTKLTELMNQFCDESRAADTPEARALLKRSYEKVIRIAGVLAVWNCPNSPVISLEHVQWAEKVVRSSDKTLLEFAANNIHDNDELAKRMFPDQTIVDDNQADALCLLAWAIKQ